VDALAHWVIFSSVGQDSLAELSPVVEALGCCCSLLCYERERGTVHMSVGSCRWHILRANQQIIIIIITTTELKVSLMTFSIMQ
jgi:hypothetical protein